MHNHMHTITDIFLPIQELKELIFPNYHKFYSSYMQSQKFQKYSALLKKKRERERNPNKKDY